MELERRAGLFLIVCQAICLTGVGRDSTVFLEKDKLKVGDNAGLSLPSGREIQTLTVLPKRNGLNKCESY